MTLFRPLHLYFYLTSFSQQAVADISLFKSGHALNWSMYALNKPYLTVLLAHLDTAMWLIQPAYMSDCLSALRCNRLFA